jgi:hypothetical protein
MIRSQLSSSFSISCYKSFADFKADDEQAGSRAKKELAMRVDSKVADDSKKNPEKFIQSASFSRTASPMPKICNCS